MDELRRTSKALRDFAENYALRIDREPGNQTVVSLVLSLVREYDDAITSDIQRAFPCLGAICEECGWSGVTDNKVCACECHTKGR